MSSSSVHADDPARRSWSIRRPATAAARMIGWARSGSGSEPGEQHLAQALGEAATPPSRPRPAAPRRRTGCRRIGGGRGRPATASGSAAEDRREQRRDLVPVQADEVDPLDAAGPLELREPRQQRMAPVELVGAEGEEQQQRSGRTLRARKAIVSRVAASAQWRSSTTNSDGRASASRWSRPSSASSSRGATTPAGWAGSGAEPRAGTSRARSPRAPTTASSRRGGIQAAESSRSASTIGRVREAAVADVRARAASTRMPRSAASERRSRTNRDLPTPASPATRRWTGVPARARSSARVAVSSSDARPTRTGLTRRPAMPPIIVARWPGDRRSWLVPQVMPVTGGATTRWRAGAGHAPRRAA